MKPRKIHKRFRVAKFLGEMYSVIDVKANATIRVLANRQAAQELADKMNEKEKENG